MYSDAGSVAKGVCRLSLNEGYVHSHGVVLVGMR